MTTASSRRPCLRSSNPLAHRQTAQTQNAAIVVSHITLVLESRKTGVASIASAAKNGRAQSLRASAYVPKMSASACARNPKWSALSLQPKIVPTSAR